jgi:hypothetical protein
MPRILRNLERRLETDHAEEEINLRLIENSEKIKGNLLGKDGCRI